MDNPHWHDDLPEIDSAVPILYALTSRGRFVSWLWMDVQSEMDGLWDD